MIVIGWAAFGLQVVGLLLLPSNVMEQIKPRHARPATTVSIAAAASLAQDIFFLALLWANLHGHLLWH